MKFITNTFNKILQLKEINKNNKKNKRNFLKQNNNCLPLKIKNNKKLNKNLSAK